MRPRAQLVRVVPLVLLGVALVPVAVHSHRGVDADDCGNPQGLRETTRIEGSRPGEEQPRRRSSHQIQWSTGRVASGAPGVEPLEFHLLRSFDPRRIYVHPHVVIDPRFEPDEFRLEWLDAGNERIPIQMLEAPDPSRGRVRRAALLYVYGGRPVEDPFWAQLRSALPQVLEGTRPLTLFLVTGGAPPDRIEAVERRAREWLASAWRFYARTCAP